MERTVKIDGKDVKLKATAYTLIIYQSEFDEDMFVAQEKILQAVSGDQVLVGKIPTIDTIHILWALIKTANEDTPGFNDWIRDIGELPLVELFSDNLSMLTANMLTRSDIVGNSKNALSTAEQER